MVSGETIYRFIGIDGVFWAGVLVGQKGVPKRLS
jgi:hypothetical protein